jgi:hypothetical protein
MYGNYYLKRAIDALVGLGANLPEDAIYPLNIGDADGQPLTGANQHVLHFGKNEIPTIGDRDALKLNADGSVDLYIQHASPGAERESNW